MCASTQKCTWPSCWTGFKAVAFISPSERIHLDACMQFRIEQNVWIVTLGLSYIKISVKG